MDLDVFIRHTGRFLRRVAGEGIELMVERDDGPLPVRVDRQQLENALLNLAINARDAMPDGGTLTIAARRRSLGTGEAVRQRLSPGAYVVVSVSDTGVGMSPEAARRAVEPFFSTNPIGKGSGLGLSTALGFAQQSGGDVSISSAPRQGTTVSLYLPEATTDGVDIHRQGDPPCTPTGPATVLVVDDERRTRRMARRTLAELGYQVLEAESAAAATQLLEKGVGVDLLFTDVVMPSEMDGRALGLWARQGRPGLKVLLTTGFPGTVKEGAVSADQALPVLKKPYSKKQLREAIQALFCAEAT